MIVGFEWLIDALECDMDALRDPDRLRSIFAYIISDLKLKTIGDGIWHKFEGEGGVTGLIMLTESHLACHTYPEHRKATFNLYCCRERPEWNWIDNLKSMLGAKAVAIEKFERGGSHGSETAELTSQISELKSEIANSKNEIAESRSALEELRFELLALRLQIGNPKLKIAGGEH